MFEEQTGNLETSTLQSILTPECVPSTSDNSAEISNIPVRRPSASRERHVGRDMPNVELFQCFRVTALRPGLFPGFSHAMFHPQLESSLVLHSTSTLFYSPSSQVTIEVVPGVLVS